MRRSGTIIVAASTALASGLAQAADLEVVKAEPTIYVPDNFLWGGVYVGGFVGGAWATADWGPGSILANVKVTTATTATTAVPLFIPHVNVPISGFLGGGQIGVNYQAGPFVFGFEGDFTGMTLKGHTTVVFSGSTATSAATPTGTTPTTLSTTIGYTTTSAYQTTADWAATFTGRVGYTFDRVLAYGKVGAAVEQDGETEASNTTITSCVATPLPATTSPPSTVACTAPAVSRAGTATRFGWTAGAGLEYAIDKHWSGFVEYDHLGFLSQLINFVNPATGITTTRLIGLNVDRVVGGANYRF